MATIQQIIEQNNSNIRSQTAPGSITRFVDANMRDVIAEELRARGVITVAGTGNLPSLSHTNTGTVLVVDIGLFTALNSSDPANGETTFSSADANWLWKKVLDVSSAGNDKLTMTEDDSYSLTNGYLSDKVMLRPSDDVTMRVGLTPGGEEIMLETDLTANQWKVISMDIVASGADVEIFFTGVTADVEIIIFKWKL